MRYIISESFLTYFAGLIISVVFHILIGLAISTIIIGGIVYIIGVITIEILSKGRR